LHPATPKRYDANVSSPGWAGACLPALDATDLPTQAEVLAQILHERRYELYLQAVRWSDLKRFGQPVKYQFMPIPITECDRNSNAPTGPGLC
jgi:hypothetical protein